MSMLICGGHLIDPAAGKDGIFDILVKDGVVAELAEWKNGEAPVWKDGVAEVVIDATGKYVMPGFIDLHVHLREPGLEYKETIAKPSTDTPEKIRAILEKAKTDAKIHILPIGAISIGQEGKVLADIKGMAAAGAVAFSEDGKSVMNSALYAEGLKEAAKAGVPVFAHCEDIDLVRGGVMNAGKRADELGLPGITNAVEDIITARDIFLARETGVRLHLCHCSTKDSVKMIALAKAEGLPVSGETGPHYFTMIDEEIPRDWGNYKMNPPLRGKEDKEALILALQDNVLEAIATDHAPHSKEEKEQSMLKAPFGIVGSETAYALTVTELVRTGKLTMTQLVERMSASPANILGINKGSLKVGMAADITIADAKTPWTIEPEKFYSKGKNTPFAGKEVYGKIYYTIADGKIAFEQK